MLTETIRSVRKCVNGSQAVLDSLSFAGAVPSDLLSAYARGGFQECHLEAPPLSVNVRIGGTEADPVLWHGTPLDDLRIERQRLERRRGE